MCKNKRGIYSTIYSIAAYAHYEDRLDDPQAIQQESFPDTSFFFLTYFLQNTP